MSVSSDVVYDPFSWATQIDPFPVYRVLRDRYPAYVNPERGFWALSRYDDVVAAARDWESFTSEEGVNLDQLAGTTGRGVLISTDPPAHDHLRRVLRPVFHKDSVGAQEHMVRGTVRSLLETWPPDAVADAAELAWAVPLHTISDLLGIPAADRTWVHARTLEVETRPDAAPQKNDVANTALSELWAYFSQHVVQVQRASADTALRRMMEVPPADGPLSTDDVVRLCLLLFAAGSETAAGLIGSTIRHLATLPDEHRRLRAQVDQLPQALEEVLRYDSPIQGLARTTTREVTLHGTTIPHGSRVLLLYGSANRDDRRFPEPDRLDLKRPAQRTLAFGNGVHFCIGVHLARMEARVTIEEILARYEEIALAGPIEWLHSQTTRALTHLPVVARRSTA